MTVRDFVAGALAEIGVLGLGADLEPGIMDRAVTVLQRMQDRMQIDRLVLETSSRQTFVLVPSTQTYTIGPTGTLVIPRPRWIASVSVVPVEDTFEYPVDPYDRRADWMNEPNKAQTDDWPSRYRYDATAVNGTLTVWPVPTTAARLYLDIPVALQDIVDPNTVLLFSPGYWEAWHYNYAKRLCRPFSRPITPDIVKDAVDSLAAVHLVNQEMPAPSRSEMAGDGHYDIRTNRYR